MTGYQPGEQPQTGKFIKLNTNENPYPASRHVAAAIQAVVEAGLAKYPDPQATAFRLRAAEILGVAPDWILCGNGSDDILTIVTRTFVGQSERLRMLTPSYSLYKTLAEIQGASRDVVRYHDDWTVPRGIRRRGARFATGLPGQSQQPFRHALVTPASPGDRRTLALPSRRR